MGDETRVQIREVQKGVEAMGGIAERYMIRLLGPLGKKIAAATKTGRIMALIGVLGTIVFGVLIYLNSLWIGTSVTRKGLKILTVRYEMEGYGIPFLIGIGLVIFGIMQKKR